MPNDTTSNYDVSRKTEPRLQYKSSRNRGVVYVIGTKPLVFDPLGNGNLALRINYQKVSRLNESQEVASKWGLGRSTSFHTACNILAYNMLQLHDQNWQMSRGSKIIHIPEKQKGQKQSTERQHGQRSGHATEVLETDPGKHVVWRKLCTECVRME